MKDIRRLLSENQISVVLLGLLAGLLLPGIFRVFHPWNTLLLQLIFFLSALRVNIRDLKGYAVDWKMHMLTAGFMLIVLPLAVYFPLAPFAPDWALAFLIVLAAPTGMTIALIADFFGGKPSLALIIVLVTSVLAPFTIPAMVELTIGKSVPIDSLGMLRSLAEVIIVPFALAFLFQHFAPNRTARGDKLFRSVSVAAFGILIASIVSKAVGGAGLKGDDGSLVIVIDLAHVAMLVVLFVYLAFLFWLSYRMVYWRSVAERITIALSMIYMNFTLSLYIADRFFAAQRVVPKLIIILLLLNLMLPAFKIAAARVVAHAKKTR